jgi:hypothetical protein
LRPRLTLTLLLLLLAACAARPVPQTADRPLAEGAARLAIEFPPQGAVLGGPNSAYVAGRVAAGIERGERLDLVLAIDTSGSTCEPVGAVDPGEIHGEGCGPRGDGTGERPGRIVDVELAAARALLARLDPELTRVGVVSFGAGAPIRRAIHRFQGPDAGFVGTQLEIEPTADFAAVEATLDALAAREPEGATNVSGAVTRSVQTLLALPSGSGRRMVILLSDGIPTAPRLTDRENLVETVRAAARAARSGVRVLSFAIGEAVDQPVAAIELAERTGGAFYPIRDAASLPSIFSIVHLDQIADLAVTNTTTGDTAVHRRLTADGSWDAVVPLAEGANALEIRARTEFGAEVVRTVEVRYASAAPALPVPDGLYARRDAARSAALAALAAEHASEREALARKRAELMAEIERERDVARGAAAVQRRELDLEAQPPAVGAGPAD